MREQLHLGGISVDVIFKDIKNVHLSVHPPTGRVRISAPERMNLGAVRLFAISKLDWIKRQQIRLRSQERESPREYIDRESHYLWGRRYLLQVLEIDAPAAVQLSPSKLLLRVRPGTNLEKRRAVLSYFYRDEIRVAVPPLVARWEPILGVSVEKYYVQQMKTKWGSCNAVARAIRLNTELAKKPKHCLEYVVVHEMVHFFERHHGDRFVSLMNRFMPQWRLHRDDLNGRPLAHAHWEC